MAFIDIPRRETPLTGCTPGDVSAGSSCFTCLPEKTLVGAWVYLTAQLWKEANPMADITPGAVIAASRCFTGCMSAKQLYGAIVYLLCQIESGGGSGGFPLLKGIGSPQGVVVAAGAGQRYWDTEGGVFYTNVDGTVNGWNVG